jgi:hypothetical protein
VTIKNSRRIRLLLDSPNLRVPGLFRYDAPTAL